jgi:hypothetical protein
VLTRLTRTCLAVRSKTKYSPGLAEASWPKRERAGSRSATSSKPHGIPTKVRGKKIESRFTCCCIKTSTPSNYCNRYAIRANARVLYSLVNLLFFATRVPVPTYLLDSQSELVPFTSCRRVLFPTFLVLKRPSSGHILSFGISTVQQRFSNFSLAQRPSSRPATLPTPLTAGSSWSTLQSRLVARLY